MELVFNSLQRIGYPRGWMPLPRKKESNKVDKLAAIFHLIASSFITRLYVELSVRGVLHASRFTEEVIRLANLN
jgi:hypothetical protein